MAGNIIHLLYQHQSSWTKAKILAWVDEVETDPVAHQAAANILKAFEDVGRLY